MHPVSIRRRLNSLLLNLAFGALLHLAVGVLPDGLIDHVEERLPVRGLRVYVLVCLSADAHRRHVALVVLLLVPRAAQLQTNGIGAPGGELALVVEPGQVKRDWGAAIALPLAQEVVSLHAVRELGVPTCQ